MNDPGEEKDLIWKLPEVRLKDIGKVGPAFGFGAGCGVGFGIGLVGGVGLGPGIPGLQIGLGLGAGCGVGYGFGYGVGKGIAHDEKRRYSNAGEIFDGPANFPTQDDIGALVSELVISTRKLVISTKKLVKATSIEIEKWRR